MTGVATVAQRLPLCRGSSTTTASPATNLSTWLDASDGCAAAATVQQVWDSRANCIPSATGPVAIREPGVNLRVAIRHLGQQSSRIEDPSEIAPNQGSPDGTP